MATPDITISPEAAAYARRTGAAITLRRSPRRGCCGGRVELVAVSAEAPPDTTRFAQRPIDAPGGPLTLYIEDGLDADGPLNIGLDRLFGLSSLFVEGAGASINPEQS